MSMAAKYFSSSTTLADQDQQATTRVVVVLVELEVLGQVRDPAGEHGDLDLGGAGVALLLAELGDDLLLDVSGESHGISFKVSE